VSHTEDESSASPAPPGIKTTTERVILRLRTFIQDILEKNKLDDGFELGNDELRLAIELTIDGFNNTAPFSRYTLVNFPSLRILLYGGAIEALTMAAIASERNELPFNVGNISTVIKNRAPGYLAIIGRLEAQYERMKDSVKTTINMEAGFGLTDSPYGYTELFLLDD
jgi:hypothetical protein